MTMPSAAFSDGLARSHIQCGEQGGHTVTLSSPRDAVANRRHARFAHRRLRQPCLLRHQSRAPVSAVIRHRLQRFGDYVFHLFVGNRPWGTGPRFVQQSLKPPQAKALAPLPDCGSSDPQLLCHLIVRQAFGTVQNDPRPHCQRLRRLRPPRQQHQFLPLVRGQFQRFLGSASTYDPGSSTPVYLSTDF